MNIIVGLLQIILVKLAGDMTKLSPAITNNKQPKSMTVILSLLSGIAIVSESCILKINQKIEAHN